MAKTQTYPSIGPTVFSVSQGVYEADAQSVSEALNFCFGHSLANQGISVVTSTNAWGSSGNELSTHRVNFSTGAGYVERFAGQYYIDPDVTVIGVEARVTMPAANTGRVRITVGGTNAVLTTFAAGATATISATLNTSSTGTGLVSFSVECDHITGASASCWLVRWGIRTVARTSALPDPSG